MISERPGSAAQRPGEPLWAASIDPPRAGFAGPIKRSVTIAGHSTSISLEPVFWTALEREAAARNLPLSALVAQIDALRIAPPVTPNLASAIRSWLFESASKGAGRGEREGEAAPTRLKVRDDYDGQAIGTGMDRMVAGLEIVDYRMVAGLEIVDYDDSLAAHFDAINAEWIEAMFTMEDTDRETLSDPRGRIVDRGGAVLFVAAAGLGIVGTCALQRTGDRQYELTKMGVRAAARGRKAGEFLLAAVIDRAATLGAERLYLLTNHACASAIHLYEKLGFIHDAGIMRDFGTRYARCDVAMLYPPDALVRRTANAPIGS